MRFVELDAFIEDGFQEGLFADELVFVPYHGAPVFEGFVDRVQGSFFRENQGLGAVVFEIGICQQGGLVDIRVADKGEVFIERPLMRDRIVGASVAYFDTVQPVVFVEGGVYVEPFASNVGDSRKQTRPDRWPL